MGDDFDHGIAINNSFESRRKLMKKVEHLVAKAEASVTPSSPPYSTIRGNDDRSDVHVSDVSSSYEDDEDVTGDSIAANNVSVLFDLDSGDESSLNSLHDLEVKVNHAFGIGFDDGDDDDDDETELDIHTMSTPITSGGANGEDVQRSLLGEIHMEQESTSKPTKNIDTTTPNYFFHETKSTSTSTHTNHQFQEQNQCRKQQLPNLPPKPNTFVTSTSNTTTNLPAPQDRSVASKVSAASSSAATPSQFISNPDPIISPPFTFSSPARTRYNNKSFSDKKSSTRRTTSSSQRSNDRIFSPPRPKSAYKERSSSSRRRFNNKDATTATTATTFEDMKQEIEHLRAQFRTLDSESRRRRNQQNNNDNTYNPEDSFEKNVEAMSQKTNAMADVLNRNFVRSDQLQRENDELRQECNDLKSSMNANDHNNYDSLYSDDGEVDENMLYEKVTKTPGELLRDLNPTDDYVKRKYPPIPKTPGTMFATEMVEVMTLEVGEHAYLAEIMDRQWRTTTDYRP